MKSDHPWIVPAPHADAATSSHALVIDTTPQVIALLRLLLASGLHGRTVEEVAERLLCESLRGVGEIAEDEP